MSDYPTDQQLLDLMSWTPYKYPIIDFIQEIEELWWMSDWGFSLTGEKILKLELHTGGWSGNEEIIAALRQNPHFWRHWKVHRAGGHYYFGIEL